MVMLGIEETCIIRADYHHCMKEVWPKAFGSIFGTMRPFLEALFFSKTEEEHNRHAEDISNLRCVQENHGVYMRLQDILDNRTRYAGYILRQIEGNLGINSDNSVEIYHSSNVAHLGDGGNMSISEQLTKLMDRDRFMARKDSDHNTKLGIAIRSHKSKFDDVLLREHDQIARAALSNKAYSKFVKRVGRLDRLQLQGDEEAGVWVVSHRLRGGGHRGCPSHSFQRKVPMPRKDS